MQTLNLAVRFMLELGVIFIYAYWGFITGSNWLMRSLLVDRDISFDS